MKPLTDKQAAVLAYCGQFFAANDQIPPRHFVANHFGWSSYNAAAEAMEVLGRKGYIERNANGKWRFTAKGRAFITEQATSARWFPTNGSLEPTNGLVCTSSTC